MRTEAERMIQDGTYKIPLTHWDFPDTKSIPDGYSLKSIPEATPENMVVLMEKINELTIAINTLVYGLEGIMDSDENTMEFKTIAEQIINGKN